MALDTASRPAPQSRFPAPGPRTRLQRATALWPGLAVCAAAVLIAMFIGQFATTISPLLIAIVIGIMVRNVVQLPAAVDPGITFAAKKLLRSGVVLLGLQLALSDILGLGAKMIIVVIAIVTIGIITTTLIGRLLGISVKQRLLIACGFSICGAAAVAAVDGVIDAEEEEVATAVALVVIFGTLMIPIVPLVGRLIGLSSSQSGMWAGGSIHEIAQVVAAGGAIGGVALTLAVLVKLARILMLAPVMAFLSWRQRREMADSAGSGKRPPLVPLFVIGFLVMALIRTAGILPDGVLDGTKVAQTALLAAAMFGLGCGVHLKSLLRVGVKPFLLAIISTVVVASVALTGVVLAS